MTPNFVRMEPRPPGPPWTPGPPRGPQGPYRAPRALWGPGALFSLSWELSYWEYLRRIFSVGSGATWRCGMAFMDMLHCQFLTALVYPHAVPGVGRAHVPHVSVCRTCAARPLEGPGGLRGTMGAQGSPRGGQKSHGGPGGAAPAHCAGTTQPAGPVSEPAFEAQGEPQGRAQGCPRALLGFRGASRPPWGLKGHRAAPLVAELEMITISNELSVWIGRRFGAQVWDQ